jgi:hypothetical protein
MPQFLGTVKTKEFSHIRMMNVGKTDISSTDQDIGEPELSNTAGENINEYHPLWKAGMLYTTYSMIQHATPRHLSKGACPCPTSVKGDEWEVIDFAEEKNQGRTHRGVFNQEDLLKQKVDGIKAEVFIKQ